MISHIPNSFILNTEKVPSLKYNLTGPPISLIINEIHITLKAAQTLSNFVNKNIVKVDWKEIINRSLDCCSEGIIKLLEQIRKFERFFY